MMNYPVFKLRRKYLPCFRIVYNETDRRFRNILPFKKCIPKSNKICMQVLLISKNIRKIGFVPFGTKESNIQIKEKPFPVKTELALTHIT